MQNRMKGFSKRPTPVMVVSSVVVGESFGLHDGVHSLSQGMKERLTVTPVVQVIIVAIIVCIAASARAIGFVVVLSCQLFFHPHHFLGDMFERHGHF
jgi:hypothetical protein